MSQTAVQKLQHALAETEKIQNASSMDEVQDAFNHATADIKAAFEKIHSEVQNAAKGRANASKLKSEVREWWIEEKRAAYRDEVVAWVFEARNGDHHVAASDGQGIEVYSDFYIKEFASPDPKDLPEGAVLTIEGDGGWLKYDEDTPFERRERYPVPGHLRIFYRLVDPPTTHGGQPLEDDSPKTVLRTAHAYVAELWKRSRALIASFDER